MLQGLLDRLVTRESTLPFEVAKLRFTQADPYSSRRITPQEQQQYLDKLAFRYSHLIFFQVGENPPLARSGPGTPWHEARQ